MRILKIISKQTSLNVNFLRNLAFSANHRYKTYSIPKRNSKEKRIIEHPSRQLKFIQRWLSKKLFSKFPIHEKAFAYKKDINILDHANLHKNNNYLLKVDFKDFFPSIKASDIKKFLQIFKYKDETFLSKEEIDCIIRFVTRNNQLTIGAPSSPAISNVLMYDFDTYWDNYSKEKQIVYSRYADDIYFSTNKSNLLQTCLSDLRAYLKNQKNPCLYINDKKVVFTSKKRKKIITGLVITSKNSVSLGRDKKREIKSLINSFKQKKLEQSKINYLNGFLSYINSVEPNFIISLQKKYGNKIIDVLMKKNTLHN